MSSPPASGSLDSEVNEQLLARPVLLPHHRLQVPPRYRGYPDPVHQLSCTRTVDLQEGEGHQSQRLGPPRAGRAPRLVAPVSRAQLLGLALGDFSTMMM